MKRIVAAMLACSLLGGHAAGEEDDSDLPDWAVKRITPVHDSVSRWIDNSSRNIDGFFGTDDYLNVENRSYLRISNEVQWLESEDAENDFGVRFRLDVPTTRKRLRLIIESDPEESQGTLSEQGADRLRNDQQDTGNSVIGLDRLGRRDKTRGWSNKFGGGVKLRWPLDPYARFTSERLWSLGDGPWQLDSYNRLSWFESDGYSARTRWDVGRPLDDTRHLRFVTQFQWQEEEDTLEFAQSAHLDRVLGRRSAIRYSAAVVGNGSSGPRINDGYLQALYRRNLHKEILFVDLIPELHFPRDANFDPRWALTLRLELFFRGDIRRR